MKQYINGIEVKSTNYKKYAALLETYRNADVYMIDFDTCIVTGYRPFGNIRPTYALTDVFNRTAQKADTPEKCKDILNAYVKEVLSNV